MNVTCTSTTQTRGNLGLILPSGVRFAGSAVALATLLCVCPAIAAEWRIVALNGSEIVNTPSLRFAEGGVFTGNTGCDRFKGSARYENGDLVIESPVAATRMACVGERLTTQEDLILSLLAGRISVDFDPLLDSLILRNDGTQMGLVRNAEESVPRLAEPHAGRNAPVADPPYMNPFGLADDLPIHSEPDPGAPVVGGWSERQYLEASDSALRAGQSVFDAVGRVPYALGVGAPMTHCAMGVAREGGGSDTVVVGKPEGFERFLYFTDGAFVGPDTREAGGGFESAASREGDLFPIRVDDERYEIPEAGIFGG
jgi:heat shock protein HslJ